MHGPMIAQCAAPALALAVGGAVTVGGTGMINTWADLLIKYCALRPPRTPP